MSESEKHVGISFPRKGLGHLVPDNKIQTEATSGCRRILYNIKPDRVTFGGHDYKSFIFNCTLVGYLPSVGLLTDRLGDQQ